MQLGQRRGRNQRELKMARTRRKLARKLMASRSDMWEHFEKIMIDGVLRQGKCNYCRTKLQAHPIHSGTSALHKHFGSCKYDPNKHSGDSKQARYSTYLKVSQGVSVLNRKIDPEAIRTAFVEMIIEDELPLNFLFVKNLDLGSLCLKHVPASQFHLEEQPLEMLFGHEEYRVMYASSNVLGSTSYPGREDIYYASKYNSNNYVRYGSWGHNYYIS